MSIKNYARYEIFRIIWRGADFFNVEFFKHNRFGASRVFHSAHAIGGLYDKEITCSLIFWNEVKLIHAMHESMFNHAHFHPESCSCIKTLVGLERQ